MTTAETLDRDPKGVRIGEYLVLTKIGQGGIAEIFKGRQESLGRDVAIKILSNRLSDDPDIVRRFERESMVIARLNHPNIVHVIDKGRAAGRYYFVMEYIDGTSLREVIDSPKISLQTKIDMIIQVCKALDYAHKNGVIHRDIKPANILIDREGNPRVADFGIAQILGTPEYEMTGSDIVMGTLSYMSPEQKVSSTNVDQTTDIYALGVVLYEILTGRKPLGHFKPPSELNPQIGKSFDPIVLRCLAQEAHERFQSAVELKNALLEVSNGHRPNLLQEQTVVGAESFAGKCRFLDTIKETKFASTILVENRVNKKLYVIKRHQKGDQGRKEAKLLSSLKHEHVVPVIGVGGDSKQSVIVMEYAPGGSLADRMVQKYDWKRALSIAVSIAKGLEFAHRNNIVHGNLRPSNVLFDSKEQIRVSDFGLPSHYDGQRQRNWYAPPEHKISKAADLYALGVIFHQLIASRTPSYDAMDRLRLEDVEQSIPSDLATLLGKLCAIRIGNRYATAAEFISAAESLLQSVAESSQSARPVFPEPTHSPARPISLFVGVAIGGGAVALIALIAWLIFR